MAFQSRLLTERVAMGDNVYILADSSVNTAKIAAIFETRGRKHICTF